MFKKIKIILLLLLLTLTINQAFSQKFVIIGDYGADSGNELLVANMVKSWSPDFIITVEDNNYDFGETSTIDENIGQFYHDYIKPYSGSYGSGSPDDVNRFFPVQGDNDWDSQSGLALYLNNF